MESAKMKLGQSERPFELQRLLWDQPDCHPTCPIAFLSFCLILLHVTHFQSCRPYRHPLIKHHAHRTFNKVSHAY